MAFIRANRADGLVVSIGGEIGEVGKENSTEDELRSYLDGFRREFERRAGGDAPGLSKVSVQTGPRTAACPCRAAAAEGEARLRHPRAPVRRGSEYGLAGAVQHGASTLPDELFHHFPKVETAEIHPATDPAEPPLRPPRLRPTCGPRPRRGPMRTRLMSARDGETDAQFVGKTRKKALGPNKRRLWDMPEKGAIIAISRKPSSLPLRAARDHGHEIPRQAVREGAPALASRPRQRARGLAGRVVGGAGLGEPPRTPHRLPVGR